MAGMTLDDIKDAVNKKYAPWEIDMGEAGKAVLHPLLRLTSAERRELMKIQSRFNGLRDKVEGEEAELDTDEVEAAEADSLDALREMIRIVGKRHAQVETFLSLVGDDLAILLTTFQEYSDATQSGEASASPAS